MAHGFVYLTVILDWYSRRALAWRVSVTMDVEFIMDALEEAFEQYGCPAIMNTDQGSQYTSERFTQALKDRDIQISMDSKGAWRDNVFVERLWRSVKYEDIDLHAYETPTEVKQGTDTVCCLLQYQSPTSGTYWADTRYGVFHPVANSRSCIIHWVTVHLRIGLGCSDKGDHR
jgi:transposase InsO family protein